MLADPGIVPLNKTSSVHLFPLPQLYYYLNLFSDDKCRRSAPEYSDDESGSDNEIFLRPEEFVVSYSIIPLF